MTVWEKATEGIDVRNWPHRFTKTDREQQIGRDEATGDDIFAVEMTCMDCNVRYINGRQPRPADPCPARTMEKEKKRLMS